MDVFGLSYAKIYDLLYEEKPYQEESNYIHRLIQKHRPGASRMLELGCGTGNHAEHLAKFNYDIVGIDASSHMIALAQEKAIEGPGKINFDEDDICSFRSKEKFDIVISLFHVMSYLTQDQDLSNAMKTAAQNLLPSGLFIFDFWYGPAMTMDRPKASVRRVENEKFSVTRHTYPTFLQKDHQIEVKMVSSIENKSTKEMQKIAEKHLMRYLFLPEIKKYLEVAGFDLIESKSWLTDRPLSEKNWYGLVVAQCQ